MKIDFYILDASKQKALFFACQLLEKAYAEQKQVYVHTPSQEEAERLDALIWTYKEDSFLPHNLYQPNDTCPPPIQIGYQEKPAHHQGVLLNISQEIPTFYKQFNHLIEIVFTDPVVQQLARERYKQYREAGFEIETIKLKAENIIQNEDRE